MSRWTQRPSARCTSASSPTSASAILSGDWPPGHRIPFEHELSAEYRCSRMTVNKALSQLAKTGLIERRRRSGSFVARPRSQAAILEIHDIKAEVQALGLPYRYELMRAHDPPRHGRRPAALRRSPPEAAWSKLPELSSGLVTCCTSLEY